MQCEECRTMILEHRKGDLSKEDAEALRAHLEACPECCELDGAAAAMASLSKKWVDQKMPEWDRVPSILKAQSQWPLRLSWVPLAAALLLVCFVLLRLEVKFDRDGFVVSFGGSTTSAVDETELDALRAEVLSELKKLETRQDDKLDTAMFQVQNNQAEIAKDLLVSVLERGRQERQAEMTRLFANWRKQRISDMEMLGTQVQTLYEGQIKNRKDLVAIAQYVDERPFTP